MPLRALVLSLLLLVPVAGRAETLLLMAEEQGCMWCAKWNREIAHIYPKTPEGKAAPLQRYDVHGPAPEVTFLRRVHFTPTFILVRDGVELDRIEGYPGEDFFWSLLGQMLKRAEIPLEIAG